MILQTYYLSIPLSLTLSFFSAIATTTIVFNRLSTSKFSQEIRPYPSIIIAPFLFNSSLNFFIGDSLSLPELHHSSVAPRPLILTFGHHISDFPTYTFRAREDVIGRSTRAREGGG
jgi:hypothetical protein